MFVKMKEPNGLFATGKKYIYRKHKPVVTRGLLHLMIIYDTYSYRLFMADCHQIKH